MFSSLLLFPVMYHSNVAQDFVQHSHESICTRIDICRIMFYRKHIRVAQHFISLYIADAFHTSVCKCFEGLSLLALLSACARNMCYRIHIHEKNVLPKEHFGPLDAAHVFDTCVKLFVCYIA